MEVHPYSYFWWCGYFWGPWVSFVTTDEFSVKVTKITSRIGVSWTHSLCPFKPNELWPYYQKFVNQTNLNHTTLWSFALQVFDVFVQILLIVNLSLNVVLCETNLDDSIDSGSYSVRGYLPLIRSDSGTHMHGLAVYVKEGLPFTRDLSQESSANSCLCFRLALLYSISYFFFL